MAPATWVASVARCCKRRAPTTGKGSGRRPWARTASQHHACALRLNAISRAVYTPPAYSTADGTTLPADPGGHDGDGQDERRSAAREAHRLAVRRQRRAPPGARGQDSEGAPLRRRRGGPARVRVGSPPVEHRGTRAVEHQHGRRTDP